MKNRHKVYKPEMGSKKGSIQQLLWSLVNKILDHIRYWNVDIGLDQVLDFTGKKIRFFTGTGIRISQRCRTSDGLLIGY